MKIINLFAGPGAGKSTTASGAFNILKKRGINCEYVYEVAKDLTWEERNLTLDCQPYIFGKQLRNIWRLKDKVDFVITDSPLLLSLVYLKKEDWSPYFSEFVIDQFRRFDNINFFLHRTKDYNPIGRNQLYDEACAIDRKILDLMNEYYLVYREEICDDYIEQRIVDYVLSIHV